LSNFSREGLEGEKEGFLDKRAPGKKGGLVLWMLFLLLQRAGNVKAGSKLFGEN